PPRISHRQHQHGNGFAVTLRHPTHGVLGAGAVLHAERTDLVPGGDARDRIRHVDADALLPHHDRADVGIGRVLDEMIDRIAAEDFYPLALHDFRNRGAELHADLSPWTGRCWARPSRASWNRNPSIGKACAPPPSGSSDMHPGALGRGSGIGVRPAATARAGGVPIRPPCAAWRRVAVWAAALKVLSPIRQTSRQALTGRSACLSTP